MVLPCLLTLPWAFLILLVDLASTGLSEGVTGPGPAPGQAVSIYENGQLIAVLAAAALLIAALFLARWRRVFALSAWCVIVWEIGWFFLLVHLEQIR